MRGTASDDGVSALLLLGMTEFRVGRGRAQHLKREMIVESAALPRFISARCRGLAAADFAISLQPLTACVMATASQAETKVCLFGSPAFKMSG